MFGTCFAAAPMATWWSPKPCIRVRMEPTPPMEFPESVQDVLNVLHHKCYLWDAQTCSAVWGNSHAQCFFGDIFNGLSWEKYVTDIVNAGGEHAEATAVYMDTMTHSQAEGLSLVLSTRAKWLLPAYVEKLGVSADETLQLYAVPVMWHDKLHLLVHYKPMPDHDLHLMAGESAQQALGRILDLAADTGRWVREDIWMLKRVIMCGGDLHAPLSLPPAIRTVDEEVRRSLLLMMTGSAEIARPPVIRRLCDSKATEAVDECKAETEAKAEAKAEAEAETVVRDVFTRWDIDEFDCCSRLGAYPLTSLGLSWLTRRKMFEQLPIDAMRLKQYMHAIESQYRDVPYHNVRHVFGVLHLTGMLLD